VEFREDLPPSMGAAVVAALEESAQGVGGSCGGGGQGQLLREGLRVAIVGRPNVGKSSLLQCLSRRGAGPIVAGPAAPPVNLVEAKSLVARRGAATCWTTAGIRPHRDPIEQLGIRPQSSAMATRCGAATGRSGRGLDKRAEPGTSARPIPDQVPQLVGATGGSGRG